MLNDALHPAPYDYSPKPSKAETLDTRAPRHHLAKTCCGSPLYLSPEIVNQEPHPVCNSQAAAFIEFWFKSFARAQASLLNRVWDG